MTIADEPRLMTEEEFLDLPDDGVERWLINGELREDETGRTTRNVRHGQIVLKFGYFLFAWQQTQPKPHGLISGGEAGFRLPGKGVIVLGADVAYIDPETAKSRTDRGMIQGAPILAVEVVSPSDRNDRMEEKVDAYLAAGTKIVWVVSPRKKTITVYRGDHEPAMFNQSQTIDAEPHLPGFKLQLSELFTD